MTTSSLKVLPGAQVPGSIRRPALAMVALAAFLCLACTAPADEPDTRDPLEHFFTPTFGDLPEEMQLARDEGKLGMLLFFMADACPYCQHMLHKVLNRKHVQDWYQERFVSIAVDIHGDVELTDFDGITLPSKVFADHRRVFMTPVLSFLDLNGNEIYRHLGMIRTPEEMLLLGEYIEGQHYFDTEYRVFKKMRGMQDEGVLSTSAEDSE